MSNFGLRLAELDERNAYVFSEFVAYAQIVRGSVEDFKNLTKAALCGNPSDPALLKKVIRAQVSALQGDLINLAYKELEVLTVIASRSKKRYDPQILKKVERGMKEAVDYFEKARMTATKQIQAPNKSFEPSAS